MSTEITNWLRGLGLEQYASAFDDNAIDAGVLPELTADDLKDLGVNLVGHRRKLLAAIAALRDQGSPAETRSASAPSLPLIPNDPGVGGLDEPSSGATTSFETASKPPYPAARR